MIMKKNTDKYNINNAANQSINLKLFKDGQYFDTLKFKYFKSRKYDYFIFLLGTY